MQIPETIAADEELGRGVSSRNSANRARRSLLPINEFLPRQGETRISVDRLSVAPLDEALAIADDRDSARNRNFYGWAVVSVANAALNGRIVTASPLHNINPYHADIILPQSAADNRDEQKRHAQELRDASHWRARADLS